MTVTVFRSTDASAPVLTGNAGSLITVLDAILVNGYGSVTAAGWTKPFSATNGAVYKAGSGVQHFYHVDDNSPNGTALGKEGQFRGSETASAFQTGTGFFPTAAQFALGTGLVIRKSSATGASAIAWTCVADDRTCYLLALTGDAAGVYQAFAMGEFYSLMTTTDSYRSLAVGRITANSSTTTLERLDVINQGGLLAVTGHYIPRSYTGLGSSITAGKGGDVTRSGQPTAIGKAGSTNLPIPDPVSGAVHVAPIHVFEDTVPAWRGRMRGLFQLCHAMTSLTDGNTIAGSGAYAGRTFLVLKTSGNTGAFVFDITGPWETN